MKIVIAKLAMNSESMFLFDTVNEKREFSLLFLGNFEYFGEDVVLQDGSLILLH